MSKRTIFWVAGIFLFLIFGCIALFVVGNMTGDMTTTIVEGDAVALVRVEGTILPGRGDNSNPFAVESGAYSTNIIEHLQRANENDQVKAVVLYVDSPGGSVYASDEIALQVAEMNKPIISAMGSMAASGGYYVSAPTDEIWASAHTLTCSIGVIAQFINYDDLAAQFGVESVVFKSGKHKDMGNPFRDFTEEEEAIWQALIDEAYDAFVTVVSEGRDIADADVRAIADGRICTGKQAQEAGLVDSLGYLPDVIKHAGELAGIEGDPPLIEYTDEPGIFDVFSSMMSRPSPVAEMRELLEFRSGSMLMYLYSQ